MKAMNRHAQSSEEGDQLRVLPWLLDVCGRVWVKGCKHISVLEYRHCDRDLRPPISFDYPLKFNDTRHLQSRQCLKQDYLLVSFRRIYRLVPGDGLGGVMVEGRKDLAGSFPTGDVGCETDMSW